MDLPFLRGNPGTIKIDASPLRLLGKDQRELVSVFPDGFIQIELETVFFEEILTHGIDGSNLFWYIVENNRG